MNLPKSLLVAALAVGAACSGDDVSNLDNKPPVAVAGADVVSSVGLDVRFDGSKSSDIDGVIEKWSWHFSDDQTIDTKVAIRKFTAAGSFTATLTVTDDGGATATDSLTITIGKPNALPTAAITGPATAELNVEVSFSGSGSADSDGTIATYAWDFGDGGTGTGVTAKHKYTTIARPTVKLTVTDDVGGSATAEHTLQVVEKGPELPATSRWTWALSGAKDPNGGSCNPSGFAALTIVPSGTRMTVTEGGGTGGSTVYSGTYTAATRHFNVVNAGSILTQTLDATFAADFLTFTGTFTGEASNILLTCRAVNNVKGTKQ